MYAARAFVLCVEWWLTARQRAAAVAAAAARFGARAAPPPHSRVGAADVDRTRSFPTSA